MTLMTEADEKAVDDMMFSRHRAVRSSVTGEKWLTAGDEARCYVCAYVCRPDSDSETPTLYMVHWTAAYKQTVIVIYRDIEKVAKET